MKKQYTEAMLREVKNYLVKGKKNYEICELMGTTRSMTSRMIAEVSNKSFKIIKTDDEHKILNILYSKGITNVRQLMDNLK